MLCKEYQEYPNPKEHLMLSIMLWGGGFNHLFIGKKVILSLFNKINRLFASLVCKTYGYKQSFSLVSLAM
ncbi:MAG: hypothetical protein IJT15_04095, partial [Rickettsiales bacterium]|nr:hypothetical protein [Rickettsiales bacterium]